MRHGRGEHGGGHDAQTAETEMEHEQDAEAQAWVRSAGDQRVAQADEQPADHPVHGAYSDQALVAANHGGRDVGDGESDEQSAGHPAPMETWDEDKGEQRAKRRPVAVAGGDQPGLSRIEAVLAPQSRHDGGHDVDVERARHREQREKYRNAQAAGRRSRTRHRRGPGLAHRGHHSSTPIERPAMLRKM